MNYLIVKELCDVKLEKYFKKCDKAISISYKDRFCLSGYGTYILLSILFIVY